jgi:hypothetical protein
MNFYGTKVHAAAQLALCRLLEKSSTAKYTKYANKKMCVSCVSRSISPAEFEPSFSSLRLSAVAQNT